VKNNWQSEAAKRIVALPMPNAEPGPWLQRRYKTYVIPDDVGGRFVFLTGGLLPLLLRVSILRISKRGCRYGKT
jgi:glucose-6-phosphate isomerase